MQRNLRKRTRRDNENVTFKTKFRYKRVHFHGFSEHITVKPVKTKSLCRTKKSVLDGFLSSLVDYIRYSPIRNYKTYSVIDRLCLHWFNCIMFHSRQTNE